MEKKKRLKIILVAAAIALAVVAAVVTVCCVLLLPGKKDKAPAEGQTSLYEVVYYDGDDLIARRKYREGEMAEELTLEDSESHVFGGWNYNGSPYDFSVGVTSDMNLYASWNAKSYKVAFSGVGTADMQEAEVAAGSKYTLPACEYVNVGMAFDGWKINGTLYAAGAELDPSALGEGYSISAEAQWREISYTVRFLSASGELLTEYVYKYSERFALPIPEENFVPLVEGQRLVGFSIGTKYYDLGRLPRRVTETDGEVLTCRPIFG